jgi:hypothetical protein
MAGTLLRSLYLSIGLIVDDDRRLPQSPARVFGKSYCIGDSAFCGAFDLSSAECR